MDNNGNMPAMPCEVVEQYHIDESQAPKGAPTLRERKVMGGGMTKREMMAMHILPALIEVYDVDWVATQGESVARDAAMYADLLLAELERTK